MKIENKIEKCLCVCALLGSWELCFHDVAKALGCPAAASFRAQCPRATAVVEAAHAHVASGQAFPWVQCFGQPQPKRQAAYAERVAESKHRELLAELSEEDRVDVRSAGGSGAGHFLLPPDQPDHVICDDHLVVAFRRRLRCPWAAGIPAPAQPPHCNHRNSTSGACCGAVLDARDFHAATCNTGGGVEHGHNRIRDWLASWLGEQLGQAVPTETYVPGWDRQSGALDADGNPRVEHARLDLSFVDGEGRRAYVDVAVTSAGTTSAEARRKRAATDGAAAADTVRAKRSRYPAAQLPNNPLTPFVVEALGRLSPEAEGFLRAHAPEDKAVRSLVLRRAKQALSVHVQVRLAELLLSAEPGRRLGAAAPGA